MCRCFGIKYSKYAPVCTSRTCCQPLHGARATADEKFTVRKWQRHRKCMSCCCCCYCFCCCSTCSFCFFVEFHRLFTRHAFHMSSTCSRFSSTGTTVPTHDNNSCTNIFPRNQAVVINSFVDYKSIGVYVNLMFCPYIQVHFVF